MTTTPALTIRPVGLESFDAAFDLLVRFFREEGFATPKEEMRASLRLLLASPAHAVFLARRDGQAVGVATVSIALNIEYGRSAEIDDLYVLPQARQQGVAAALIQTACAWCRRQGCAVVLVTVTAAGNAAHGLVGFYQRRGFVDTGRVILVYPLEG
ncbi:MAG: GNAT family N-acetyltransferase [Anaerolineae bacterium]|nr:GNAT family N-acetyltransferase [Anaerolineae bacterium]